VSVCTASFFVVCLFAENRKFSYSDTRWSPLSVHTRCKRHSSLFTASLVYVCTSGESHAYQERTLSHTRTIISFYAGRILDVWLDRAFCLSQTDRRKLSALALCTLIPADSPGVRRRLYGVLQAVVEALNDVARTDEETGEVLE